MANRIIKRPDGKFAVWCTVVDDFTVDEATLPELLGYFAERAVRDVTQHALKIVGELERGEKPYCQFTTTYEEACEWRDEVHGKEEANDASADGGHAVHTRNG